MEMEKIRCLIIGSGPAGYTAAIYASRANLNPVVFEGPQPGGQLTITTEIENFPGYPEGITGPEMMDQIRTQALRFGADIRPQIITKVDFSKRPFLCEAEDGKQMLADAVIIATGASAKYLGLEDDVKYRGMGVSGGDTACEEAIYLSNLAMKVYLIVRKDYLRASKIMQQRVFDNENIEVLFNTNTVGLFGEDGVEGAHLVRHKGTENEEFFDIDIDGFFLAIGHKPNTDIFKEWIELDEAGYIKVDGNTSLTNVEGVFAAGDVADPRYRQGITAAGMGAKAAIDVERFLLEH